MDKKKYPKVLNKIVANRCLICPKNQFCIYYSEYFSGGFKWEKK